MQRRPDGHQRRIRHLPPQRFHPGQTQGGLNRNAVVLLHLEHCDGQRPHLMLPQVVEAQMQRQPLGRRFEHQLRNAQFPDPGFQLLRQPQILEPVRHRNLHNVRGVSVLAFRQVKSQLPPHIGQLQIVRPEKQLPGVERAARRVADLPVSLDDRLTAGEMLPHFSGHTLENLGEQSLIFLAERKGVPVGRKAIHIVLGQIRPAHHPQLAEKPQPAAVQPHRYPRPGFRRRPPGRVGFLPNADDLHRFRQRPLPFPCRQILKHRHISQQPLVGGIKVFAVRPLPLPGQRHQFIQRPVKLRVHPRRQQRRLVRRFPLPFRIFLSHFGSSISLSRFPAASATPQSPQPRQVYATLLIGMCQSVLCHSRQSCTRQRS